MSQPSTPYSGHEMMLSPTELQAFEAPLIALANLSGGDLRKLFYAFFYFLNRRTDFYCILPDGDNSVQRSLSGEGRNMGFREGQAEQILLASFRQFPLRRVGPKPLNKKISKEEGIALAKSAAKDDASSYLPIASSVMPSTKSHETIRKNMTDESKKEPTSQGDSDGGGVISNEDCSNFEMREKSSTVGNSARSIRYTDGGKQIPVGNGGSTSRYVWTQTLDEVTMILPVPNGIRAKDLDVKIGASNLSVQMRHAITPTHVAEGFSLVRLEGTFYAKVRPSESTWTLDSTTNMTNECSIKNRNNEISSRNVTTVQLTLEKVQKTWWGTVLTGDPQIDTTLVDSTRRIDTYDEETQAQIRRIIFDQQQERLGLPSSGYFSEESAELSPLPKGVELIDNETLEKASVSKK